MSSSNIMRPRPWLEPGLKSVVSAISSLVPQSVLLRRVRAALARVAAIYRQHRATAMSNLQDPEDCSTRLILSATYRAYEPRHRPGRLGSRFGPPIQGRPPAM